MISAKKMSEAIRMKRKKVKEDGVENMVDTGPAPQMDPNSIMLEKQEAQWQDTMDTPKKNSAPDDPADEELDGTQKTEELKRRMARTQAVFNKLKS